MELETAVQLLLSALTQGPAGVALAVSAGLVVVVRLLSTYGARFLPFLEHKAAKLALPLVLSLAGSVALALSAGQALTVGLLLNAVMGALSSIGLFSAGKNAVEVVRVVSAQQAAQVLALAAKKEQGE